MAAMNRCLMKTQSSGGFTDGATSCTFATITHGPASARARVTIAANWPGSRTLVAVAVNPIARAAALSRSAPCFVAVSWPPVVPYSPLSQTMMIRFAGFVQPIVAREPRFMSNEPSPSRTNTRASGRAMAKPSPIDDASPMLPQV